MQQQQIRQTILTASSNLPNKSHLYNKSGFTLTIHLSGVYSHITNIWIFSDKLKVVSKPGDEKIQGDTRIYVLLEGHYIIRIEINSQITDNKIIIQNDYTCSVGQFSPYIKQLESPILYSSALLGGEIPYGSSHEYYTNPAVEISKKMKNNLSSVLNSGLFIFLRYPDEEVFREKFNEQSYWDCFSLLNDVGKSILNFPDFCINDKINQNYNYHRNSDYIGLSEHLEPGLYFLKYEKSGGDSRLTPIYIYEGWYTQLFMTVGQEPLFGSIRVFISRTSTFNPMDRNNYYIDICLDKLQNNDYSLDSELLRNIAYGKYESPMLGLLGAYIYLSSKETKEDHLFKAIVYNLQNKILKTRNESPDIWALNLLSYQHFGKTISNDEKIRVPGTPMLRVAFEAIKKAASTYSFLIAENSLNDHVSENQIFDSPYNTFKPISSFQSELEFNTEYDNQNSLINETENVFEENYAHFDGESDAVADSSNDTSNFNPAFENKSLSLQNALDHENILIHMIPKIKPSNLESKNKNPKQIKSKKWEPSEIGPIGCAIISVYSNNKQISNEMIAKQLNLPISTINRIRTKFNI
ncbi:hypothetical protein [Flavobacterium sp.]|uniref:hypothetical protein n=1 Tax=Flavobacterium sp. TaxID=239 RepID=UPI00391C29F3